MQLPPEWDIKYCLPMTYCSLRLVNTRDFINATSLSATVHNHNISQRTQYNRQTVFITVFECLFIVSLNKTSRFIMRALISHF